MERITRYRYFSVNATPKYQELTYDIIAIQTLDSAASRIEYKNCKLSIIGTLSDHQKTVLSSKSELVESKVVEQLSSLGIDVVDLEDQILFTESLDLGTYPNIKLDDDGKLIITVTSKIDVGRRRALQSINSSLTITAFISEVSSVASVPCEYTDFQDFDGVNPYSALFEEKDGFFGDNYPEICISNNFKPLRAPPLPPFKKTAFVTVKIEPLVNASLHVYSLSSHGASALLGVQLETKSDIPVIVKSIEVDIPGALVTSESSSHLPVSLIQSEQYHALYSVRLFDSIINEGGGSIAQNQNASAKSLSVENSLRKSVSFSINLSRDNLELVSYFCARLAMNGEGGLQNISVLANHGRLFEGSQTKLEVQPFIGLEFSLNVLPPIESHKVFSVQMLISNTGTKSRNLTISIPSGHTSKMSAIKKKSSPDIFMDPNELIRAYQTELEIPATMICLESDIILQDILPSSCRLVMLHFIVIQGTVHSLPDIFITDRDSGKQYILHDTLQIYIQERSS